MVKTGLVIYAAELDALINFYQHVLDLELIDSDHNYAELHSKEFELVILATESAREHYSMPATPRESIALKPVFFIKESIKEFREKVSEHHGHMYDTNSEWTFNTFNVCDGWDPEGNIYQVRTKNI